MCSHERHELIGLLISAKEDIAIALLKWSWTDVRLGTGLHGSLPPIPEFVQKLAARSPINAYVEFLVLLEIEIQVALRSSPLVFGRLVRDGRNLYCHVSPAGRYLQIAGQQMEHHSEIPITQTKTE